MTLLALLIFGLIALAGGALAVAAWRPVLAGQRRSDESAPRESADDGPYQCLIETAPDGFVVVDPSGVIHLANQRMAELVAQETSQAMAGRQLLDFFAPEDRVAWRENLQQLLIAGNREGRTFEFTLLGDGRTFPAEFSSSVVLDSSGKAEAVTFVVRDITERKAAEEQLQQQALHDPLTNLPNRALLLNRLQHALVTSQREDKPVGLLLLDLDHFKEVNDTFGHHYGDLLLRQLSSRLKEVVRNSDTVARLGGDELAVLLPGADEAGAELVAEKISEALVRPFELEGQSFDVRASIGITLHPAHGSDAMTLLRQADVAMYLAKRGGGGHILYSSDEDTNTPRRLALMRALRVAIEADQFYLQYQPKVNLQTGHVDGVEALLRWRHPDLGFVPPDQFIPLAEQTGLIKPLTEWVLHRALHQCRMWQDIGLHIPVAVNLSARSLLDPDLADGIARILHSSSVRPQYLELELTESAVMHDPRRAIDVLAGLHDMGIRLSVDDFGTGYSSLAYLKKLPVDKIKIDKSFVLDMAADDNDRRIVRATISLGHDLGLKAVAEGVETQAVWDLLDEFGCDLAQGHHLARPLLPADCTDWVIQWLQLGGHARTPGLLETA